MIKKPLSVGKFVLIIILFMGVFAAIYIYLASQISLYPPTIIDYRPIEFHEQATSEFFYSIGNNLKYGKSIDSKNKTIWTGEIDRALVSPDNSAISIVSGENLYIISGKGQAKYVAQIGLPNYGVSKQKPKPIGVKFYRDDLIQWSPDSKGIYLVEDEYQKSPYVGQSCTARCRLIKYGIRTGTFSTIISSFPAWKYFLGLKGRIYYSEWLPSGEAAVLNCWWQNKIFKTTIINTKKVQLEGYGVIEEKPYYSFPYPSNYVLQKGVHMKIVDAKRGVSRLYLNKDETRFSVLEIGVGESIKGPYWGVWEGGSVFLPGDKYLLINITSSAFTGQLLIDVESKTYHELPQETRVYRHHDTNEIKYKLDETGITEANQLQSIFSD